MSMYWWSKKTRDPKSNRGSRRGSQGVPATYEQDIIEFEPSFLKAHAGGLLACMVTFVACTSLLGVCWKVATYMSGGLMYIILCVFSMAVSLALPVHWHARHRRLVMIEHEG